MPMSTQPCFRDCRFTGGLYRVPVVHTGCFNLHLLNEPLQQVRILVPPAVCVIEGVNSPQQSLQKQICPYTLTLQFTLTS